MFKAVLVSSIVFVIACTGKKDEERAAPPGTQPPVVPTAPAPAVPAEPAKPAAAASAKLGCDWLVPQELRDKHFAGMSVEDSAPPTEEAGGCRVTKPDGGVVQISAACPKEPAGNPTDLAKALKGEHEAAKELAGVGAAAVLEAQPDGQKLTAWDGDSPCRLELVVPPGMDASAIAQDLLARLPPT